MNPTARSWIRFTWLALLLVATLGLLMARDREEVLPPHSGLSCFPRSIAQWHSKDLQTSAEMTELFGPGEPRSSRIKIRQAPSRSRCPIGTLGA
jgi:hypothetical protein